MRSPGEWIDWFDEHPRAMFVVVIMAVVMFAMLFDILTGCGYPRRYKTDYHIMNCTETPGGNIGFECDSSPTGWCAGDARWDPSILWWCCNDCMVRLCPDQAARKEEDCHCNCFGQGERPENGKPCYEDCMKGRAP